MMKKRLLTILALAGLALGQQAMAQQVRWTADNGNGKGLQCYTSKEITGPWTHHNMQERCGVQVGVRYLSGS